MDRLVLDSWEMLQKLLGAGRVQIPTVPVNCFEERHDDGVATAYPRFATCRELVEGYGKNWEWPMFNPDRLNIGGVKVWCVLLHERERKANGTIRGLAVPFATFVAIFKPCAGSLSSSENGDGGRLVDESAVRRNQATAVAFILYLHALRPRPRRRKLIYATRDPADAPEVVESDRRVLRRGRIVQRGIPSELRRAPASRFVAGLVR